ncbi:S9 family peptidase [Rubricoccus marinus]|uniref:S9 family peptidase n=1 Tax=Rubricoccus marinus TaxID=716817 RepID=A0A259U0C4_9BACT|nr:S9 family peptidase [Rubricoccus marinus]OZC03449.1 S9 family peptidase [Rubricoccus marinus]
MTAPRLARFVFAALFVASGAFAQERPRVTAEDYAQAERFLYSGTNGLVTGGSVSPTWQDDGRFTYKAETASGAEFVVVDPARGTREVAFDPETMARALSAARGEAIEASALPFSSFWVMDDGIGVDIGDTHYVCDLDAESCDARGDRREPDARAEMMRRFSRTEVYSPDGSRAAFIRNWNLWVRDVASGEETQLTTDGVENYGYATDNAGWRKSDRPVLKWSLDGRMIATQQQDEREVGEMYLVETTVGTPVLQQWKYPLPGDSAVAMLRRVVIDVDAQRVTPLALPMEYHRATLGDDLSMDDYHWSPDGTELALASTPRDHKSVTIRLADARTGAVRDILTESEETHFESVTGWHVLWDTREIVWNSQRDDWSNLYLYDLDTGALKNRITSGEGPVSRILRIDEDTRTVWYEAMGREPGQDPYFRHAYRASLDGGEQVSLTPEAGDHSVQIAASGAYLVDTYSSADTPPVVELRDRDGRLVMELETTDISALEAHGWKPPMRVQMTGPDGETQLYGLLFRPTDFDPNAKYPIINQAYPGPQSGSIGSRSFRASWGDRQALAELGFVVVSIDGMGTPGRSKSFHDAYYGAMGRDNTLPSQVAGMQDLARQFPWIDIDRVGIWGHSGGGFIAAGALFRYPDFFDVGISESGNHDQRNYEDDWGERYQGLLVRDGDTDNYAPEANQDLAANLKGKLLLAHGMLDDNVPPYNTLLVVQALIDANKDFDLIMFPNARHGFGRASNYMTRRRWDYFVEHLLGAEPPENYVIGE